MERLDDLLSRSAGGLAVVYGRRRIGKTRLLLEWRSKHGGAYIVADQSSPDVQRRYIAEAIAAHLPGFNEVEYPDWAALLGGLAREARHAGWHGPVVIDELPYLVSSSPELPSILQRWIDHDARQAGLVVVLAGSSQRMMQGLVLSASSPLYGRAREIMHLGPLGFELVAQAFGVARSCKAVECYAAWGGVPRYWELATETRGSTSERFDRLVLDPLGPLHQEPSRLLVEEHPPAIEVRPVLDAIGMGANRVSEIAARIGHRATSLSRPLERIVGMGLVRREVPFGELEKKSRRSVYRIADPFIRLWFRAVAPNRAFLATASSRDRLALLSKYWPEHLGFVWEEICRARIPVLGSASELAKEGPWLPAGRWWRGNAPEWDIVSEDRAHERILLGEAKWSAEPFRQRAIASAVKALRDKPLPRLPERFSGHKPVRALFVPETLDAQPRSSEGIHIVTCDDLS
ncbi:MAG: ATP-binding protein [Deltaproteobacteria bacterium]|nr:ATP-binding protein [Deltaproteobacteria bacterium]